MIAFSLMRSLSDPDGMRLIRALLWDRAFTRLVEGALLCVIEGSSPEAKEPSMPCVRGGYNPPADVLDSVFVGALPVPERLPSW